MKEIYQIKKVHPEVYQIMEAGLDAMYVICEEKQAVLMDAGTGIGNLEACVRRLTEMPFKVWGWTVFGGLYGPGRLGGRLRY